MPSALLVIAFTRCVLLDQLLEPADDGHVRIALRHCSDRVFRCFPSSQPIHRPPYCLNTPRARYETPRYVEGHVGGKEQTSEKSVHQVSRLALLGVEGG